MNPVIYSIFNTEFREAFSKILTSYVRNECCNNRTTTGFTNYDTDHNRGQHHNNLNHDTSNFNLAMKRQGINNDTPRASPGHIGGGIGSTGDRSPGGQIIITTGSANKVGGQGVPTVKTPVGSCTSRGIKRSSKKVLKDHDNMSSKVRRPLLPFYKRSQSEKKRIKMDNGTTSSSNEDSGGNKVKRIGSSNLGTGTVRSCSLDTFPLNSSSSTAPKPKVSTPLLAYSHVDIHTIDEHGGTISAI